MSLPAIKGDAVIGLVNNAALLLALGILYDLILPRPGLRTPRLKALQGLLIGAIGVAVMFNPWKLTSDIVFDTRSVLLSIAGLFFGPIPASVAAIVTGAFRVFYHGGIGAIPGVAVITTATAIGLLWRHLRRRCASPPDWLELYAFGLIVHIVMLLCMLTLGWSAANRVNTTITVPVLLIYPIATVLLGSLLAHQQVRRRTEEALRREHALL